MDESQFEQAQKAEALQRENALAQRVKYRGESALKCIACEYEIPLARRLAVPGCQLCIDCQQLREVRR